MTAAPRFLPFRPTAALCLALLGAGCVPPSADTPDPTGEDTSTDDDEPEETGTPTTCPAETGPTMHTGNIDTDEVWRAEDGPHVLPNDFTIHANVVVEACARVQLGGGVTVDVGTDGSLVVEGRADAVVTFERLDPDAAWSAIQIVGGTMALEHAVLQGGGDPLNRQPWMHGALVVRGRVAPTVADPTLFVRDVVIRDSASTGIRLQDGGAFVADSQQLEIAGAAAYPISADADSAGEIPTGEYTGNGDDRILLTTAFSIAHDMTLTERGVPYFVGAPDQAPDLRVAAAEGTATLTLEPGVEVQFARGGVLRIDQFTGDHPAQGALVAVGTPDAEIVLTSAEPAPAAGDWAGLWFGGTPAAHDALAHVRVEYAGGEGSSATDSCIYAGEDPNNHAAIRIAGVPAGPFITHTTVVASARHGIDRGWRDDVMVDFSSTNHLDDVAECGQTVPRSWSGACPDPVPCD